MSELQAAEVSDIEEKDLDGGQDGQDQREFSGTFDDGKEADTEAERVEDDDSSDEATETDEEQQTPQVEFSEDQQKILNDLAAKKTKKLREAERRAEEAERKLQQFEAAQPPQNEIVIPEIPDPYDSDFKERLAEREAAIARKAQADYEQKVREDQKVAAAQNANKAQMEAINSQVDAYKQSALKLGITETQLQQAGSVVASVGLRQDVVLEVLKEPEGGLMTMYMAKNPGIIGALNNADSLQLGQIYGQIKAKAKQLRKRTSTAPDPVDVLKGNGVAPKQRGPKGATYE